MNLTESRGLMKAKIMAHTKTVHLLTNVSFKLFRHWLNMMSVRDKVDLPLVFVLCRRLLAWVPRINVNRLYAAVRASLTKQARFNLDFIISPQ